MWRLISSFKRFHHCPAPPIRIAAVADDTQRIDSFTVDQDIHPHQVRRKISDHLVVHRAVAAGDALESVMQVIDDFGQRQIVSQHHARRRKVFLVLVESHAVPGTVSSPAHVLLRLNQVDSDDRLPKLFDVAWVGNFLRAMNFKYLTGFRDDFIGHVGSRLHQIDI